MRIARLDPSCLKQAAATTARAFFEYPLFTFFFPDREWRARNFSEYCELWIAGGFRFGQVYTTSDQSGVSIWLPPGRTHLSAWEYIGLGGGIWFFRMGWKACVVQAKCELYTTKVHEAILPGPHRYLWGLAVDPDCQGRGIGTSVMQPGLDQADQQNLPCYLETNAEQNIPFYLKRGFELVRSEKAPGIGLPFWCFVRMPK